MNLHEFFTITNKVKTLSSGYGFQELRPQIICMDGVRLSVQGSNGHYCSPRENGMSYYSSVEVGYPSIRPPQTWEKYFDGTWQDLGIFGTIKQIQHNIGMAIWAWKNIKLKRAWYYLSQAIKDNATNSVYGYIPTELVEEFIVAHGGINEEETFKEVKDGNS